MYEASTQAKARLQAQDDGKLLLFFYAYGCESHVVCLPKLQLLVSMLLAFASISNRPFPNCSKPLFQSEAKCEAVDTK